MKNNVQVVVCYVSIHWSISDCFTWCSFMGLVFLERPVQPNTILKTNWTTLGLTTATAPLFKNSCWVQTCKALGFKTLTLMSKINQRISVSHTKYKLMKRLIWTKKHKKVCQWQKLFDKGKKSLKCIWCTQYMMTFLPHLILLFTPWQFPTKISSYRKQQSIFKNIKLNNIYDEFIFACRQISHVCMFNWPAVD